MRVLQDLERFEVDPRWTVESHGKGWWVLATGAWFGLGYAHLVTKDAYGNTVLLASRWGMTPMHAADRAYGARRRV
jgi:hypothetical protein